MVGARQGASVRYAHLLSDKMDAGRWTRVANECALREEATQPTEYAGADLQILIRSLDVSALA